MLDSSNDRRLTGEERMPRTPFDSARQPCGCRQGPWFVAETQPGRVQLAEYALSAGGWTVFLPMHLHRTLRHKDKIVPLFDPYLFVSIPPERPWQRALATPWVNRILGSSDQPQPVPDAVVDNLRARTSDRRVVDDPLWQHEAYPPGTPLMLAEGALAGLAGVCRLAADGRVRLLLSLLGRDVELTVPASQVMRA